MIGSGRRITYYFCQLWWLLHKSSSTVSSYFDSYDHPLFSWWILLLRMFMPTNPSQMPSNPSQKDVFELDGRRRHQELYWCNQETTCLQIVLIGLENISGIQSMCETAIKTTWHCCPWYWWRLGVWNALMRTCVIPWKFKSFWNHNLTSFLLPISTKPLDIFSELYKKDQT